MNLLSIRKLHTFGTLVVMYLSASAAAAQNATSRIVKAANAFLATLDEKQRQSVSFAFDDEQQRVALVKSPGEVSCRAGLSLGELSAAQQSAAMALL